VLRLLERLSEP